MARKIESGMVFVNSSTMSDSRLPYGGVKNSGYGRTSADNALYEFTNNKVIFVISLPIILEAFILAEK